METKAVTNLESQILEKEEAQHAKVGDYKLYEHLLDLAAQLGEGGPLSGVVLSNGKMGCMMHGNQFVELERSDGACAVNGMTYFQFSLGQVTEEFNASYIDTMVLMLPMLNEKGGWDTNDGWYTAVDECWREIKSDGSFGLPIVVRLEAV